jgi:hypothetical protein
LTGKDQAEVLLLFWQRKINDHHPAKYASRKRKILPAKALAPVQDNQTQALGRKRS